MEHTVPYLFSVRNMFFSGRRVLDCGHYRVGDTRHGGGTKAIISFELPPPGSLSGITGSGFQPAGAGG